MKMNRALRLFLILLLCLSMSAAMITGAAASGEASAAASEEAAAPAEEEVTGAAEEEAAGDYEEFWWEQYTENTEDDLRAPGVDENGQVTSTGGYILLTSDTHSVNFLAKELLEYANGLVREDTGDPDACVSLFALGGDFADSGLLPDAMTMLKHAIEDTSPNTVAVYTKGNHEGSFSDEEFEEITGMPRIGETAVNADGLYYFYSFGMVENQTFTQEDIDLLAEYLASHNDGKPVFVLSHFPIHYLNATRTVYDAGAKELLDVLNQYPQVIFTWGHNHSEADPSYGTVRFPGETITYGPNLEDTVGLNFTYLSNGSLRYGVNRENGVLVKVNEDGSVRFRFLSIDQHPADDRTWTDSAGTEFEPLVAGECGVIAERTLPALNDDYYSTINAAQVFIARPKVGKAPAELTDVASYNDRYTVTDLVWSTDGASLEPGALFDFDTAYTAAVTLKASDGYTMAEDLAEQHNTAINPAYHGPMDESYTTGTDAITVIDDTTVVIEHTFANTVEAYDPPIEPAAEIVEGHQYVMASVDDTAVSVYYIYEYQEGARRQNYKPRINDVVIIDGKLASKTEPFETFTATMDDYGYILWNDASLLDHAYGDDSIETVTLLNVYYRNGKYEMETEPGDIAMYNNWNIDENGLPFVNNEGVIVYPCTDGNSIAGTTDPAECNMRLYDVGEAGPSAYIIEANIAAPVTGETPDAAAVWTPADDTFRPETEYTAVVEVRLDAPVADEAAAIGRMNGRDVELAFSEDGLTAALTFTFPATNAESEPADVTAVQADAFEDGKTYIIVSDGMAVTSMHTADGRFLDGEAVVIDGEEITEGITEEMLFTVTASDTEGAFYIEGSEGYLIGRKETDDAFFTWGVTTAEEPSMTVSFEDGMLYTTNTGVASPFSFGGEPDPSYFYLYNDHFNYADFAEGGAFVIYEVTGFADMLTVE